MDAILGTTGDDVITAGVVNPTTGAAITTLNAGDVIDGGAGTDTLNITMTATNNNSLAGVTVKNVENVYVTGANFQTSGNAAVAALTAATAAKAATAASLAAAQAAVVTATQQGAAADAVTTLATSAAQVGGPGAATGGLEGEDAVLQAASATVASAASNAAVATAIAALTGAQVATAAAATAAATQTTLTAASVTAYTGAQYVAAAKAALLSAAGNALASPADDNAIQDRATLLANTAEIVKIAVDATQQDQATAIQLQAAADAVAALATEALVVNATTETQANLDTAGVTAYTAVQLNAAALAALKADDGSTLVGAGDGPVTGRAAELATEAAAVVNYGSGDFTLAQLNSAAGAALTSATGVSLQTNADDSTNIANRAADLGTSAPGAPVTAAATAAINAANTEAAKAVVADNTAASALAVATAAAAGATVVGITGSQFVGAEQVWLDGANSGKANLTVSAAQIAGLNKVTSLDNKISFGATGVLALEASSGKVDIAGAAGGLTIAGEAAGSNLTLTNAGGTTVANGVKSLTVDMAAAATFNVAGMGQLTTVNSVGAGGVTINPVTAAGVANSKLNSITTGDGKDTVRINTATVKDDLNTPADETVNAVVNTGAGDDVVRVNTTGKADTTVNTGAGKDTIYVTAVSEGVASIDAGADADTVHLAVSLGSRPNLTIDGGSGSDMLVIEAASAITGQLNAVDYLRMNAALSNFEAVRFNTTVTNLDVSKLDIGSIGAITFNNGTNTITEVAGQTLTLGGQAAVTATDFNPGYAEAVSGIAFIATGLDATAAGYKEGDGAVETVYGGALAVTTAVSAALTLKGSAATVTVAATLGAAAGATLVGVSDVESLTVNLASGYLKAASSGAATVALASFNAGVITDTSPTTYNQNLESLSSLKVNGSGSFTVDNSGSNTADLVSLTTIDVSGMTAIYDKVAVGATPSTVNKSVTTITLNANAAETVILGGARDTVFATTSTVETMDTIIGFQLAAKADDADDVDTARSDVLNLGGLGAFEKFTTTATTLIGALTEAAASADNNLVFHFGGDTYVYVDSVTAGTLADGDGLVKLVGLYDLDLLVQANVII